MKRKIALLLAVVLLFGIFPVMALASDPTGSFGGCDYEYADGTLTISVSADGDGVINNGTAISQFQSPWQSYGDDVTVLVVEEGITYLCGGIFKACGMVEELYLPRSLERIGPAPFWYTDYNTKEEPIHIYYSGTPEEWKAVQKDGDGAETAVLEMSTMHYYYNYPVTVTLDPCGGTLGNTQKNAVYGKNYGALSTPSRPGFTFDGWYTEAAGGEKVISSTKVTNVEPHTLYAHWTGKQYTVKFNGGEYTEAIPSIKVTAGQPYGELPQLTLPGRSFTGWYTAKTDGERITADSIVNISATTTLYARWSSGTMENFVPTKSYTNQFVDVEPGRWFYEGVSQAFSYGFINGMTETTFEPMGNITLAHAVTIAARLHKTYFTGSAEFETGGTPWYQVYVDYARENGILTRDYADYNAAASRADFAMIFSAALPEWELPVINQIEDMAVPDVDPDAYYADSLYKLYRAGILTGSDEKGNYKPDSSISRCEAATLMTRMANPSLRQSKTMSVRYVNVYDAQGNAVSVAECLVPRYVAQGYSATLDAQSVLMTRIETVIYVGESFGLSVLTIPTNANNVTWSSSNSYVASVDASGRVTGKSAGTCTITATTLNGLSTSCTVKVMQKPNILIQSAYVSSINSVEGVNMIIDWRNNSGKVINYMNFYVQVLDLNGSVLYNQIGGASTFNCYVTGPIQPADSSNNLYGRGPDGEPIYVTPSNTLPGEYFYKDTTNFPFETGMVAPENAKFGCRTDSWSAIMYNGRAAYIRVSYVIVEYADGTKETIYSPYVGRYTSDASDARYHQTYMDSMLKDKDNAAQTEALIDSLNGIIWEDDDITNSYNYMRIVKTSANTVRIDNASFFVEDIGDIQRNSGTCYVDKLGYLVIPTEDNSQILYRFKLEGNKLSGYYWCTLYEGLTAYSFTRYN